MKNCLKILFSNINISKKETKENPNDITNYSKGSFYNREEYKKSSRKERPYDIDIKNIRNY